MLAPRCNKRECSVRLYEDDGCESTFSEHRGPPSPGAPLALKHPQGYDEVPVMVKTECDGDGAIAYQVLHTDQTQLGEHSETEGGLLVKEEDHSAMNPENESYEVMIKQELDIGATMLQPKTNTCSLTPSTLWTCPYSEVSPPDPLPHRRDDVYPNVLQERCYDNSGSEHSSMGIQDGSQSGYFVASQAGFDCIAEATDNTDITYAHVGREMHKTKVCNSEIHTQPHTIYECKYCEHKSTDFREFERHGRVHVYEKPFKCDRCEYRSSREDGLTRHMRTHTGDKPFKCEYCEYRSSELVHLKRHIRTHTGERPYKCEHCEYTASQSGGLKRHMYIHTGEKPYKCDQCEYSTYTRTYLKRHTRTHIVVKPYKCEQCEYRAPDVGGLKIHMYTHTADKPFKCKCCEYSTSRSDSLTRHMRTHTGEKPYRCEQCQYSAPELGSLKRHMHIHTGDKPLKCEHCEYSTSRANCMTRHMRIHTGEKPYKCQVCEYSGSQRGHLQKHMRRHMNDTLMS